MRKATWSAAVVIALLAGAGALLSPALAADTTVKMVEGSSNDPNTWRFNPQDVTVPAGSAVTWQNDGNLQHDARTDSQEFSPLLNKNEKHTFTFNTPGRYEYYCEPHRTLGMTGVITVTGGSSTPTTAATTTTTQAGGATTTTAAKPGETTTTTAKNAAGGSTTTTTAGAADPGVTTSSAPAGTPPSPAEAAGETTTTTGHGEEAAAGDHSSGGAPSKGEKSSPIGIAFAGISTLILAGISTKLLASRS